VLFDKGVFFQHRSHPFCEKHYKIRVSQALQLQQKEHRRRSPLQNISQEQEEQDEQVQPPLIPQDQQLHLAEENVQDDELRLVLCPTCKTGVPYGLHGTVVRTLTFFLMYKIKIIIQMLQ
jgi:hypothetical protein